MRERELETEENCNILTPTLLDITAFLSHSPGLLNRGPLWVLVFSTASYLQLVWSPTDWISFALSYIIVHAHLLLVGVTNRTHSTRPRSKLYSDIPRPDKPVIYTGAFPILTAWAGHRSIYNTWFSVQISYHSVAFSWISFLSHRNALQTFWIDWKQMFLQD